MDQPSSAEGTTATSKGPQIGSPATSRRRPSKTRPMPSVTYVKPTCRSMRPPQRFYPGLSLQLGRSLNLE